MGAYRILSLDGGGTWALLQVMALQELYSDDTPGHMVLKDFDLVAANSGGSIVLGGLAANKKLKDLMEPFLDPKMRKLIFATVPFSLDQTWFVNRFLRKFFGFGAKYKTLQKLDGLTKVLGKSDAGGVADKKMSELPNLITRQEGKTHFLICGYDYDRQRATFFRSNTESLAGSLAPHPDPELAEAIHASTNAPVNFFDAPAILKSKGFQGYRFWDGAIAGLNNPLLAAVTELVANREQGRTGDPLHILSLGTGIVRLHSVQKSGMTRFSDWFRYKILRRKRTKRLVKERDDPNIIGDLRQLATSILDDPPDAATFITHVLLGQALPSRKGTPSLPVSGCVVRMNPFVRPKFEDNEWKPLKGLASGTRPPGRKDWTDEDAFEVLAALELDAVKDHEVAVIKRLGELWIAGEARNQAIRPSADYDCEIGCPTFADAREAWWKLTELNDATHQTSRVT